MKLGTDGSEKERGRHAAAESIALMRSVAVVVPHELLEGVLQGAAAGEVSSAEGHAPVLLQDGALQPLHEAVGPSVPRLGAGVADAELPTGVIEGRLELGAAVGQHATQW